MMMGDEKSLNKMLLFTMKNKFPCFVLKKLEMKVPGSKYLVF